MMMMNTDDDRVSDVETDEPVYDAPSISEPVTVKRGPGWGSTLTLFVLASGLGAVGGWALSQYVMPKYISTPDAQAQFDPTTITKPMTARQDEISARIDRLQAQITAMKIAPSNSPATISISGAERDTANAVAAPPVDLSPLQARLDNLESQIDAVIDAQNSAVAKPMTTGDDTPLELTPAARGVTVLDARLADLASDIDALRTRIDGLETDMSQTQSELADVAAQPAPVPDIITKAVIVPPFPREAVFDALTENAPPDTSDQSWLSKTLKRHISVRNPADVERAEARLAAIDAAIAANDLDAAATLVKALPDQARAAAQDWLDALQDR